MESESNAWLVIDVSCLCHRNFHALGNLSHEGIRTAVAFGMFRDVQNLRDYFSVDNFVFCFDGGCDKRREIFPEYKTGRRKETNEEEMRSRGELRRQIDRLRTKYLPAVGFRNIFRVEGYEADDVIASVCEGMPEGDEAVVVSSDNDLYQLLREQRVTIWNPCGKGMRIGDETLKLIGERQFVRKYGIGPSMWADVKALAGCVTDDVPGVEGVGEKTAVKFLAGTLKDTTKAHKRIVASNDLWERNLKLVRLPFPGVGEFTLRPDRIDARRWRKVMRNLGIDSL